MRASYSSGVLNALLEGEVHFDWVGGISAGSSCTANYLSRDQRRAERSFTDFAGEANFGGLGSWVRGKGMFHAEWIYEQTSGPDQVLPFDFDAYSANPAGCAIGAIRCTDGEMVYWGREELATRQALMKRVRASSTMPLLMPWTDIDGVPYCDGALGPTGGFAVDAARAAGYDRFVVVLTRPRGYRKTAVRSERTMRTLLRRFPAVARGLIDRPRNYNRTLDELHELERHGRAHLVFPDEMPIGNSERNLARLRTMYQRGLVQGRRELAAIRDFVGLPQPPATEGQLARD
ncbi:patatin family protein [Tessaracoccus rhinocerotis]|uniref:Patatin family protein n=2 Tax=Tessaracoccus rhinocerotis TaxID=1689449 RepID=A0A553K1R3_9ACTN|nr:patatin family protein [Tessaracoccus rhinocerotis]